MNIKELKAKAFQVLVDILDDTTNDFKTNKLKLEAVKIIVKDMEHLIDVEDTKIDKSIYLKKYSLMELDNLIKSNIV